MAFSTAMTLISTTTNRPKNILFTINQGLFHKRKNWTDFKVIITKIPKKRKGGTGGRKKEKKKKKEREKEKKEREKERN